MPLAVNVLTNRPKISNLTKREISLLSWCQNDERKIKILLCQFRQYCGPSETLTAKECSQQDPLDLKVTASFGVNNIANTWAVRLIFCFQISKFYLHLSNAINKLNILLICKINAFELVMECSPYNEEKTCYRKSVS